MANLSSPHSPTTGPSYAGSRALTVTLALVSAFGLMTSAVGCTAAPELAVTTPSGRISPSRPPSAQSNPPEAALRDSLSGPDRFVTNEYAHWNAQASDAVRSPVWDVTSGSLYVRAGVGWSGQLDRGVVDARSEMATNSAVFRATLRGSSPRDVALEGRFRVLAIRDTTTAKDPAWSGLHLWLRHRSASDLYVLSIARRDGQLTIKRKVSGGSSDGSTYTTLATARGGLEPGGWHDVRVSAQDSAGATLLSIAIDGRTVLSARDGAPPLGGDPGTSGIRADDTEFEMNALSITAL